MTLAQLLDALTGVDPDDIRSPGGDEHWIAFIVRSWQDDDFPGVERLTPIPADYENLCLLEVVPRLRSSRGRFWRERGEGYTDDPKRAGLWTADEARSHPSVLRGSVIPVIPPESP